MENVYCLFFLAWYVSTLIMFYIWYNYYNNVGVNHQYIDRIHRWMNKYKSLISGMTMAAAVTGIIDGCARVISGCMWTINIGSGAFLAVWLPQILFHPFVGFIVSLECIRHSYKTNRFTHGYLIFPLHYFAISLLLMLVPAIILTLAYPTQMFAIMSFVPTYLFTIITLAAVIIKGFQLNIFRLQTNNAATAEEAHGNMFQAKLCYFLSFIIIIAVTLITISIVLIFIYLELIGTGFAINAGPPFIISVILAAIVTRLSLTAIERIVLSYVEEEEE